MINALVTDAKTKLADQVKDGHLTQAQADRIQTDLVQRITEQRQQQHQGPPRTPRPRRPGGPGRPGLAAQRAAVAKAIGISEADLTKAIESGKTIAQVAHDHNVDPRR